MQEVKFTIYGEPMGKGRPRGSLHKYTRGDGTEGTFSCVYTPKETVNYETLVRTEYRLQCGEHCFPDKKPLEMKIMAYYKIPKSATKKLREKMLSFTARPTKKPDSDNVIKIIADSLNQVAYHDDSQIVDVTFRKFYSENPRVEVKIKGLEEQ